MENGRVDMSHVQPETFGVDGFKNPKELLLWLIANKPEEEMVFSHGDLSLPNVFFANGYFSGVIDLGLSGLSDKWQDIAIAYRSLINNFAGVYGGEKY